MTVDKNLLLGFRLLTEEPGHPKESLALLGDKTGGKVPPLEEVPVEV